MHRSYIDTDFHSHITPFYVEVFYSLSLIFIVFVSTVGLHSASVQFYLQRCFPLLPLQVMQLKPKTFD